ncbi:hypothetical protein A3I57_01510 [Candidatus Beckwithbacteria bacterium RIFCSPLOWO2_02_FULL_47_23]|uniref:Uncharacterized protein n=1 Tax=Candidatus Beckwithbacteria bacterium RIFCSPLOWO2_02_FULL_47_23 TaxID=1797463 RepID=A0A1F5E089_9BACT|nr:MAG: hypothetical protein A3I57_01510 [Candidatus Beckwithbacteria bacterium RIFCSPLOWO2_02_FULL_47_23]
MTGITPGMQEGGIMPFPRKELSGLISRFEKLLRGGDKEQRRLLELTEQVVKKLMKDISEGGRVSLFHKKDTGILTTAIATVDLKSRKIPNLWVELWGETTPPTQSSMELHKHLFGVTQHRKFISAIEMSPSQSKRAIAVIQSWDMPEGNFEINYRRDADKEASNQAIPRSNKEKINFLEQILETTVDPVETSRPFGRLYVPGDTYGGSDTSDGRTHHAYWVRDLKNLPPGILGGVQPKLNG